MNSLQRIMLSLGCGLAFCLPVAAQQAVSLNIQAQPLADALASFAQQTGLQMIVPSEVARDLMAPKVSGAYTAEDALKELLSKSTLQYHFINARTVTIETSKGTAGGVEGVSANPRLEDHLAQAENPSTERGSAQTPVRKEDTISEIIVTAQKREERLQDVPVPVTAVSAVALVQTNQLRLQDYFTRVPGLDLTTADPNAIGIPIIAIRGVTSAPATNPTVGIVIDDVPFGSSTSLGQGYQAPDINPLDLARIEVLRGPQGTLYGADSIGGLIKFVTVDPSTDRLGGLLQVGASSVRHGAEAGYNLNGAINIPLTDTLAARLSGFTRQDPGYIDNPVLHTRGVNETKVSGGRLAALWQPSDTFSLRLSALLQESNRDATPNVQPALGDLQQSFLGGTGGLRSNVQAYSATLKVDLGAVDLTSLTGFSRFNQHSSIDYTPIYGPFTQNGIPGTGFDGFGVPGTPDVIDPRTDAFSQELRLSSKANQTFEWLLGAFYTNQSALNVAHILAVDPTTLAQVGTFWAAKTHSKFIDAALFGDATFHFTDRFDVQIGARESRIKQSSGEDYRGPYNTVFLGLPTPFVTPTSHLQSNSFTYLVTPRFKLTPDMMLYARLASGYRPGGINLAVSTDTPATFKRDTTQNYEVGFKADLLQHALTLDASLYYIDWKHIQQLLLNPAFEGYYANAGAAKSQGVELSIEARPAQGLTVSAWVAYNDAKLTQAFPPSSTAFGKDGDRLPYSSRVSGRFSIDQEFPLSGEVQAVVGAALSYVGDRIGSFAFGSPLRARYPSYTQDDLRAGLTYDSWTANLFVNNLTDKRGLLGGGIGTLYPDAFQYIQPRTIGFSATKKF